MALVRNRADYAVDLSNGRLLGPDRTANVDVELPHEAALLDAGVLVITDPDVDPPVPETRLLEVRGGVAYEADAPLLDFTDDEAWEPAGGGVFRPVSQSESSVGGVEDVPGLQDELDGLDEQITELEAARTATGLGVQEYDGDADAARITGYGTVLWTGWPTSTPTNRVAGDLVIVA